MQNIVWAWPAEHSGAELRKRPQEKIWRGTRQNCRRDNLKPKSREDFKKKMDFHDKKSQRGQNK